MPLFMDQLLEGLRAAAESTRLRLLAICHEGELSVTELTHALGQSQPRVSRHLKLLCEAGLLERFREQSNIYYRVPAKGPGAELVTRLLALLPPEDECLRLDLARVEAIKRERADRIAETLRLYSEHEDELAESEAHVHAAILAGLGGRGLGDLLDIGTGAARMLALLAPRAESAVGIDIAPEMLKLARSRLHEAGLKQIQVRQGDMYQLPFGHASFDTISLDQILSQAERPEEAVREASRLLRPGGCLLIVDFETGAPHQSGLDRAQLSRWLSSAGIADFQFTTIEATPLFLTVGVASTLDRAQRAA